MHNGGKAMPHYPGMLFVAVVVLGASLVCARAETDEKGFVRITPEKVEWKTLFGAGSTPLALLDGDPSKPGIYVLRVKFPPTSSRGRTGTEKTDTSWCSKGPGTWEPVTTSIHQRPCQCRSAATSSI